MIEPLSKYGLAITGVKDGKKGYQGFVTIEGCMPMVHYNKLVDKFNEIIEVVNRLEEKVNAN